MQESKVILDNFIVHKICICDDNDDNTDNYDSDDNDDDDDVIVDYVNGNDNKNNNNNKHNGCVWLQNKQQKRNVYNFCSELL